MTDFRSNVQVTEILTWLVHVCFHLDLLQDPLSFLSIDGIVFMRMISVLAGI